MFTRKLAQLFIILCLITIGYSKIHVYALDNLLDLNASINDSTLNASNVEHTISFRLPPDAMQISSSDYIIIDLPNFSNITIPTNLSGVFGGSPSFSTSGTEIRITGIVLLPGIELTIEGVTATNPANSNGFGITIIVSEDEDGLIIKNLGSMIASKSSGRVSISATIEPPVATLQISGYSAPGTFITFTENGTVIGTDTAGINGFFSKTINGLSESTHKLRIYGIDTNNRATAPVFLEIFTPMYQVTSITDLLMPPTIELENNTVVLGEDFVVSGSGVPSAELTIFTESPLRAYSSTINSIGGWNYTITDTADYLPGDYRAFALLQQGSIQSQVSTALGFSVLSNGSITPVPPNCNISQGDLNCDTNVDLFDFSILMFYWGTEQSAGDINGDGYVDLFDFSILMFYWGT